MSIAIMICGAGLSGLLGAEAHRYLRPRDDWYDIVGFGSFFVGCASSPVFGLLVLGAYLSAERSRAIRFGDGFCTCGYDLTGNQSGRCPECGTAIKPRIDGDSK
ncbi:MAG: hypothetical protein ACKVS9_16630 [Phycisphaerae bacterium]